MKMNPKGTTIANAYPNFWVANETFLAPTDWKEEPNPCHKCNDNNKKDKQYKPVRIGLSNLDTISGKYLVASSGLAFTYL